MKINNILTLAVLSITASFTLGCKSENGHQFVDVTAPAISINGGTLNSVEAGTVYIEQGATAKDDVDGSVPVQVSGYVDTSRVGDYFIIYTATDSSNNSSSAIRTVKVTDTLGPEIVILGDNPMYVEAGTEYIELGAYARDLIDGDRPVVISGTVDVFNPGTYTINYSSSDNSGNSNFVERTVIVRDTIPPVITLIGDEFIELTWPEIFNEPGANAHDSLDGTVSVSIDGYVDSNAPGTYTLTYSAVDRASNMSSKNRVVVINPGASVMLQVKTHDYFSGDSISGSDITTTTLENNQKVVRTATVDGDGKTVVLVPRDAQRVVIHSDVSSYGQYGKVISAVDQNVDLFMQRANAVVTIDPLAGETVKIPVSTLDIVEIEAAHLIDEQGNSATSNLSAEVTIIDPSLDPALMPGNYETIDTDTGKVENIESLGAITASFKDSIGTFYTVTEGHAGIVRIPLATNVHNIPLTIGLFYYDKSSGFWIREGTADLKTDGASQYYEGYISHFTTWSAGRLYDGIQISGCVVGKDGNRVSHADINTRGVNYQGRSWAISDDNGEFTVAAKANATLLFSASAQGLESRTQTVQTGSQDIHWDQCITLAESAGVVTLTWGEQPNDLDTHFFGPSNADNNDVFLVYYGNKTHSFENGSIWLDVDDTSSFGPEITTIETLPLEGRYSYAVKHFSGSSDIAASPARVELSYEGKKQVFSPPTGNPSKCWGVFDIVVDSIGAVTIEEKGTWENTSYCDAQEYPKGDSTFSSLLTPPSSGMLRELIKGKYYKK